MKNLQKELPHSKEVEEGFLANIIIHNELIPLLFIKLHPEVFYYDINHNIAKAINDMYENRVTIDSYSVYINTQKYMPELTYYDVISITNKSKDPTSFNLMYKYIISLYIRRLAIDYFYKYNQLCYDMSKDILETITNARENINLLDNILSTTSYTSYNDVVEKSVSFLINTNTEITNKTYLINESVFDNNIGFYPNNISIYSGTSGCGKTKYITMLLYKLLENNNNVAIYWNTFEDTPSDIIGHMVSNKFYITKKERLGLKNIDIDSNTIEEINSFINKVKKYNIHFNNKRLYINEIRQNYIKFCNLNVGKFCILVVDNIMLLQDHSIKMEQTKIDDSICACIVDTLRDTRDITQSSIIMLHHLTKEHLNNMNAKYGYKPSKNNMKGSSRYHDIATQVVMINYLNQFKDLTSQYGKYKDMLNDMFIVNVEKNRDDSNKIIRYFVNFDYNIFYPIL